MSQSGTQRELSSQEVILFCDTLEAIRAAGVPLDLGLLQATPNATSNLAACMERLAANVARGQSLEQAIAAEEGVIPPVFRAALIGGFSSPRTVEMLQEISSTSRHLLDLNVAVRRGLIYPLLLSLITVFLCLFVLRRLSEPLLSLYATLRVEPPRITRLVAIAGSPAFSSFLMILALALITLILWLLFSAFSQRGIAWDATTWLPGMGAIMKNVRAARFAQTLSLLVNSGSPLPHALRLVAPMIGSRRGEVALCELAQNVESGRPVNELIRQASSLPPLLRWLIAVGHRDNSLGATLKDAATYYRQRAYSIADWLAVVTPLASVVLIGGSVTLLYGLALFGPMVELWGRMNVK